MVKLKDKIETLGLEKEIVADLHRLNIYTVRELWECQKKTLKENGETPFLSNGCICG